MMISNDLMENFEWKTEDWGKNQSLILLRSKQALTKIGILHNFANFRQRKDSQGETRRANSDRFLGPNLPQKGPLCDLCHNRKTNCLFFYGTFMYKIPGTQFCPQVCISWLFSFWISNWRHFFIGIPYFNILALK